jgi:hypothetical protein
MLPLVRSVFSTFDVNEAELVRTQLEAQGLHPFVQGGNHGSLVPTQALIELRVLVPPAEFDRALRWLDGSKIVLDRATGSGESLEGCVCAVHEAAAVATCSRCGAFLCAQCGTLGDPPICEQCVRRPAEPSARGQWAKHVVRAGLVVVAVLILGGVVLSSLRR